MIIFSSSQFLSLSSLSFSFVSLTHPSFLSLSSLSFSFVSLTHPSFCSRVQIVAHSFLFYLFRFSSFLTRSKKYIISDNYTQTSNTIIYWTPHACHFSLSLSVCVCVCFLFPLSLCFLSQSLFPLSSLSPPLSSSFLL